MCPYLGIGIRIQSGVALNAPDLKFRKGLRHRAWLLGSGKAGQQTNECDGTARQEPFGFVIAEAMANGVPLVTTMTGAAADALEHEKNCFFVAEKNSEEIVSGVFWMLKNLERKILISAEIREIAYAMYDVKFMLKNYIELYDRNNYKDSKNVAS